MQKPIKKDFAQIAKNAFVAISVFVRVTKNEVTRPITLPLITLDFLPFIFLKIFDKIKIASSDIGNDFTSKIFARTVKNPSQKP